jgi:hypothetical protein
MLLPVVNSPRMGVCGIETIVNLPIFGILNTRATRPIMRCSIPSAEPAQENSAAQQKEP